MTVVEEKIETSTNNRKVILSIKNLKTYYEAQMQSAGTTLEMLVGSYKFFAIAFTVFELAVIYFFTRPKIREQFK